MRKAITAILTIAALTPYSLFGTSITSAGTGNWNVGATWTGGVAPGPGDNAIIRCSVGDVVTIPAGLSITVGTSPTTNGGTAAIACDGNGVGGLVIAAGATLVRRGPVSLTSDTTIASGATIQHDSSLSSAVAYTDLVIDGSDSSHVTSAGNPFSSASVGKQILVQSGTGFTTGVFFILGVSAGVATVSSDGIAASSAGTVGSTGGVGKMLANYPWIQLNGSKLIVNGVCTPGNRVTFNNAADSGNSGPFMGTTETAIDSGQISGTCFDMTGVGYLTNNPGLGSAITGAYSLFTKQNVAAVFSLSHMTMTHSAPIGLQPSANGIFTLDDVSITDALASASGNQVGLILGTATTTASVEKTTGTRRVDGSYWHNAAVHWYVPIATVNSIYHTGLLWTNNWQSQVTGTDSQAQWQGNVGIPSFAAGEWSGNILFTTAPGPTTNPHAPCWRAPSGTLRNTYVLADEYASYPSGGPILDTSQTNAHPMCSPAAPLLIDGWVWEPYNGNTVGKSILTATSTQYLDNFNMEIQNSIYMCGQGTHANGWTWVDAYQTSDGTSTFGPVIRFHNNTVCSNNRGFGGEPAGVAGESNTSWAGQFQGIHSLISWAPSATAGVIESFVGTPPAGTFAGTNDYNWKWRGTGTFYRHTGTSAYSVTPGTHDQSGDPAFTDSTRNFLSWCQTLNGADATWRDCQAHFALRGTNDVDSRYSGHALNLWVRGGSATGTVATWGAGLNGGPAGAIPPPAMFPMAGSVAAPRVR
jgi:hypothetical protein